MAYIGNTAETQGFIPAIDFFSGNGSTTAFTLSRPVASVAQVQATIENVPQNPGTAFTVSGNTITFDGAPPSGTNNIYVYYTSPITQVIQPGQGTVGTAQIQNGAVIPADLSTGAPTWDTSSNFAIGSSTIGSSGLSLSGTQNIGWSQGSGESIPVIFRQTSNAATVIANGLRNSANANAFSSSYSPAWAKTAIALNDGSIRFYTDTATTVAAGTDVTPTERMRIDSSGNVGIGTVSPSNRLHVVSTAAVPAFISSTQATSYLQMNSAGGSSGIASNSNDLVFFTSSSGTERMRIDSSGNLLLGTNAFQGGATIGFQINATNNTSGQYAQLIKNSSGTEIFQMRCNGGLGNYSANNANLSDERVKTDIELAGSYLDKICAIPVKTFKYKNQTDDLLNLGVIAQDVETFAPELVDIGGFGDTPEDGIPLKAIYQTDLQYALMKCIQEQQALITQLQADVAELKGTST
jgi:hypothetical protein